MTVRIVRKSRRQLLIPHQVGNILHLQCYNTIYSDRALSSKTIHGQDKNKTLHVYIDRRALIVVVINSPSAGRPRRRRGTVSRPLLDLVLA